MKSKRRLMVLALSVLICLVVAITLTACQQFCNVTFKEEGISSQTVFKGGGQGHRAFDGSTRYARRVVYG